MQPGARNLCAETARLIVGGWNMRKKSHIALAGYLVREMDDVNMQKHWKAFYFGSILPDLTPMMIAAPHKFDSSYLELKERIAKLLSEARGHTCKKRTLFCRLGVVMHYLADYFTFPHNTTFEGNLKDHCLYERDMKHELRVRIHTEEAAQIFKRQQKKQNQIRTAPQLFDYIEEMHRTYLKRRENLADDCRWIMEMCSWVLIGLVNIISDYEKTATAVVI